MSYRVNTIKCYKTTCNNVIGLSARSHLSNLQRRKEYKFYCGFRRPVQESNKNFKARGMLSLEVSPASLARVGVSLCTISTPMSRLPRRKLIWAVLIPRLTSAILEGLIRLKHLEVLTTITVPWCPCTLQGLTLVGDTFLEFAVVYIVFEYIVKNYKVCQGTRSHYALAC